jgi:hypothetical protein
MVDAASGARGELQTQGFRCVGAVGRVRPCTGVRPWRQSSLQLPHSSRGMGI